MKKRKTSQSKTAIGVLFASLVVAAIAIPIGLQAAVFNSSADPNILPMLNSFTTLPQLTKDENDAKVIAINNGASSTERTDAAAADGYPKPGNANARYNLSDTKYLGGVRDAYIAADTAGDVPLVNTLLAQANVANSSHIDLDSPSEWASSDNAKNTYQSPRPYCRLGGSLNLVPDPGTVIYNQGSCPANYSFPSGHSRIAWLEGVSLAVMLPEVAPQIMARTAEIANYRVVLGVHYPLDIIAGRAIATRMVAYRLHDNTWRATFDAAKAQLRSAIEARCGMSVAACVATTPPSMTQADALTAGRNQLTYGFTRVGAAGQSFQAPDYSYELLSEVFPTKTQSELEAILTTTAIDSGYPLDTTGTAAGSANIGWTRLDLGAALTYAETPPVEPSDTTNPTVAITAPSNSSTVMSTVGMTASASDDVGVTKVEFYVNGVLVATDMTSPYAYSWDTTAETNGSYSLSAKAYDAAGNSTTSSTVTVTVNNTVVVGDTTNPTVAMTAPSNGSTVSGTTTMMSATATDNVGVTSVEFYVDSTLLGADSSSPYSYVWDTTNVSNGSHVLTAKAFDAANNTTTSTNITVTVDNTVVNPPEPTVVNFNLPGVEAGSGAVTFAISGTCAEGAENQAVAAIPDSLSAQKVLVGAEFRVRCSAPNTTAQVALQLDKAYTHSALKVFKTNGATLTDITDQVTMTTETVNSATVSVIRYTLHDGGFGDADGTMNSQIDDPLFVTFTGTAADISGGAPTVPNTGFRRLVFANPLVVVIAGVVSALTLFVVGRKLVRR